MPKTYCNPAPLPNYPRGVHTYSGLPFPDSFEAPSRHSWTYFDRKDHYREAADPHCIWHDGRWYLYVSGGGVYSSDDFVDWTCHRVERDHPCWKEPNHPGWGPRVVKFRGRFYMVHTDPNVLVSESPVGPFRGLGPIHKDGVPCEDLPAPSLFVDDDRLFLYWGIGRGIFGVELNPEKPTEMIGEPKLFFDYDTSHIWERYGDYYENIGIAFVEGPMMFRWKSRYYLIYSAPGTQFATYALGYYYSDEGPLGPFQYYEGNPIVLKRDGLVRGAGNGSIVEGPNQTLWTFYTTCVREKHVYERQIGYDPIGIDSHGHLFCAGPTEIPQLAPGANATPWEGNAAGWVPLNLNTHATASSYNPGHEPALAIDHYIRTWWEPAPHDHQPTVDIHCDPFPMTDFEIRAVRIIWHEAGLDFFQGTLPGPVRFKIDARNEGHWRTVLDRSDNDSDRWVDYQELEPFIGNHLRLTLLDWPAGLTIGITAITFFGRVNSSNWYPDAPKAFQTTDLYRHPDATAAKFGAQ